MKKRVSLKGVLTALLCTCGVLFLIGGALTVRDMYKLNNLRLGTKTCYKAKNNDPLGIAITEYTDTGYEYYQYYFVMPIKKKATFAKLNALITTQYKEIDCKTGKDL